MRERENERKGEGEGEKESEGERETQSVDEFEVSPLIGGIWSTLGATGVMSQSVGEFHKKKITGSLFESSGHKTSCS